MITRASPATTLAAIASITLSLLRRRLSFDWSTLRRYSYFAGN